MSRYALLLLPSSNRVYNAVAEQVIYAELQSFNASVLDNRIINICQQEFNGVKYLVFECDGLTTIDLAFLSNLSFIYALFEIKGSPEAPLFQPLSLEPLTRYDTDLISILRFPGKTNEQFTHMLLNMTLMASAFAVNMLQQRLTVFDPLCGRGTTLNQAMLYGYNAVGTEIDKADYEAYTVFMKRWLKDKRLKHKCESVKLRKDGQSQVQRLSARFAADKDAYKSNDVQTLEYINTDAAQASTYFKKKFCHVIVADLPYGIKHGNRSSQGHTRSPIQLLEQCLPVWAGLLHPGGAIGLAWNTHLAAKERIISLLENNGYKLLELTAGHHLQHRVDQAITRDIVVATRC